MKDNMLWLPAALEEAGVNVKVLDGWDEPANLGTEEKPRLYEWNDGIPHGHMAHHTATSSYVPNRVKANGYAGLGTLDTDRLYQSGGGEPFYVVAGAFPAPISSGYGVETVLNDYVKKDIQFIGKQTEQWTYKPNGSKWAGNRFYWNTEWILDGVGTWIDDAVWEMMVTVAAVMGQGMDWSPNRNIGHAQHTSRKIDLRDGRYDNMSETMIAFVESVREKGIDMWADDWTDKSWMTFFDDTNIPGVSGNGRYYCSNDGSYDFLEKTGVAWGDGSIDGLAAYSEKVNAINYVFSGLALAVG